MKIGELVEAYKTIKVQPGFTRHYKGITMVVIEITDYEDDHTVKGKIVLGHVDMDCSVML